MCDDDSEVFASADEGLDIIPEGKSTVATVCRKSSLPKAASSNSKQFSKSQESFKKNEPEVNISYHSKRKKRKKQRKEKVTTNVLVNPEAEQPPIHIIPEDSSKESYASTLLNPEAKTHTSASSFNSIVEHSHSLIEASDELTAGNAVHISKVEDENNEIAIVHPCLNKEQPEDASWHADVLTETASTIVRGVGHSINTLAEVFSQAVKVSTDDSDPNERRKRRLAEEEAERQAVSEAWSSVWNNAWGNDEGWDTDEVDADSLIQMNLENNEKHTDETTICKTEHEGPNDNSVTISNQDRDQVSQHPLENKMFWGWSGVSSIVSSVQTTGLNLVQEGVNVLEKIGKKTMSVIEQNDPGFEYTKKFLQPHAIQQQPNLSQVIREAHERDKLSSPNTESRTSYDRGNFTSQLELKRALVHLEALELVSERAASQLYICLDTISINMSSSHEEAKLSLHDGVLESIWASLQLGADEDSATGDFPDETTVDLLRLRESDKLVLPHLLNSELSDRDTQLWKVLQKALIKLEDIYSGKKLLQAFVNSWNVTCDENLDSQELFFLAIAALAEFTSAHLAYLHKFSECLLVKTHDPATDFVRLSCLMSVIFRASMELRSEICTRYIKLIKSAHKFVTDQDAKPGEPRVMSINQLVASLLLESAKAQTFMENAAHLLIPVFQLACVNSHVEPKDG